MGRWLHLLWHGGPILVTFEAGCAWSSRCSQRGTRWEACPGFALVGVRQGCGEAEGDGGGMLANTGLNRVGTHLKGPVTILLVLVGHGEVQDGQEESAGVVDGQMGKWRWWS